MQRVEKQQTRGRFWIMRLRIFDGVIFEISRVLESLFDVIEYRLAMRASIQKRKQVERDQANQDSTPLQILYPTHLTK